MIKKLSNLSKILLFIKIRPRSEKEVRSRLALYREGDIEGVISELKKNNLINDEVFAKWYVGSRTRSSPKSRPQLVAELRKFGISETLISELLTVELLAESLHNLVLKKSRILPREKLLKYLLRNGFSYSQIQAKLDEIGISE